MVASTGSTLLMIGRRAGIRRHAGASVSGLRALLAAVLATATASSAGAVERLDNRVAVFSALDKVTATIKTLEIPINETVQFGSLKVTPRVCYTRPPTEQPKTTTFVEVEEVGLDGTEKRIFTGWMFAQSPGLNAVEHPVFDVWLTDCQKPRNSVAQQQPAQSGGEGATDGTEAFFPPEDEPAELQRRRVRR